MFYVVFIIIAAKIISDFYGWKNSLFPEEGTHLHWRSPYYHFLHDILTYHGCHLYHLCGVEFLTCPMMEEQKAQLLKAQGQEYMQTAIFCHPSYGKWWIFCKKEHNNDGVSGIDKTIAQDKEPFGTFRQFFLQNDMDFLLCAKHLSG